MFRPFAWKAVARGLRRDVMTLWFALKHAQTPWPARVLAAVLTAYAFSPVDLIPDFVPVLPTSAFSVYLVMGFHRWRAGFLFCSA